MLNSQTITPLSERDDIPVMSFEAFQRSRKLVANLDDIFSDAMWDKPTPGYVYAETFWIEAEDGKPYYMLIERGDYTDTDLEKLERILFEYAVSTEMIIEDLPPTVVPARKPSSDPTRPLAKSLHTISVLENLTRYLMSEVDQDTRDLIGDDQLIESSMKSALRILKLDRQPDQHGLIAATLKKIGTGRA